jgi:hypothetical protein
MRALQIILPKISQKKKLIQHHNKQTMLMNLIHDGQLLLLIIGDDGLGVHHAVLLQEDLTSEHHGPSMHLSCSVLHRSRTLSFRETGIT